MADYRLPNYDVRDNTYQSPNIQSSLDSALTSGPNVSQPPAQNGFYDRFKSFLGNFGGSSATGTDSTAPLMSRGVANASAIGNLGLGLAGYLENRKTAGLQRQALRNDIATAREHRANRQALGESWNRGWSS